MSYLTMKSKAVGDIAYNYPAAISMSLILTNCNTPLPNKINSTNKRNRTCYYGLLRQWVRTKSDVKGKPRTYQVRSQSII